MAREYEEKTTFYAQGSIYCYPKMPFGLKNAGLLTKGLSTRFSKTNLKKFGGECR